MTYYDTWNGFIQAAHTLFLAQPLKTRYSVKYVKGTESIVLKVTDDRKCCKFKLAKSGNLRQLNQLNKLFLTWSVTRDLDSLGQFNVKRAQPVTGKKLSPRKA
ncbi:Signal recognition particle 9 kDa protein (SRP9) family protein [Babesia bovis T2Bo]|uniref:Signal recognition particle SRP9 subunit, putative n=1 Tax=Babesia bovis TaxID=5865 RepID=A7ARX9_BABBO|nr:Signal recognition particle 9 kDa protein (SRP9) family protein [Babesia bovis T2Bo]EDO07298.1 Signal recognition particle 9 kDa protein (SRP9) family protein [Babesia bovis T2Bo]|eukprot:XP_001610866.1 signal recognition particle SRP9 subunit [Babesia bovis T2Bo]